jgi:hypothetical protein
MNKTDKDRDRMIRAQRDEQLAEAVTGWATNLLFPFPSFPNRYHKLPWLKIRESRGVCGAVIFLARILAFWPFELMLELLRPGDLKNKIRAQNEVSQFAHGDHICFVYRSEDALLDLLAHYVTDGLACGEQCVCVESMQVKEKLCDHLRLLGIDIESEIAKGSLIFLLEDEVYFREGKFDTGGLLKQLSESIDRCLISGFNGFRIAGEISRAVRDLAIHKQVIEYERRVEEYFKGKKAIGFCHYRDDAFTQEMLDSVIDAHGFQIVEVLRTGVA